MCFLQLCLCAGGDFCDLYLWSACAGGCFHAHLDGTCMAWQSCATAQACWVLNPEVDGSVPSSAAMFHAGVVGLGPLVHGVRRCGLWGPLACVWVGLWWACVSIEWMLWGMVIEMCS